MSYDVLKAIKTITNQAFTNPYVYGQAYGYCQLSIFPAQADVDAFKNTAVIKTSDRINITGMLAYFDPSAAGQLLDPSNPDAGYTGMCVGPTCITPGSNAASSMAQPVIALIAALALAVRAAF